MARFVLLIALIGALASAPAAGAGDNSKETYGIGNVAFGGGEGCLFVITFDLLAPDGATVGSGDSCVRSLVGCDPFFDGCRQTAQATQTLVLPGRGTVTADVTLNETVFADGRLEQKARGTIVGGTGSLAGARGYLKGGGTVMFLPDGSVDSSGLTYVVHIKA